MINAISPINVNRNYIPSFRGGEIAPVQTQSTSKEGMTKTEKTLIGLGAAAAIVIGGILVKRHLDSQRVNGLVKSVQTTNETASQTGNVIKRKINPELIEDKDLRKVIEELNCENVADFANKDDSTFYLASYIDKMECNLYRNYLERFANYKSPSELYNAVEELNTKKCNISAKALENCADNIDFERILEDRKVKIVFPEDSTPQEKLRIILNKSTEDCKKRLMVRIRSLIPAIDANATQAEKTKIIEKYYTSIITNLKETLDFLK